MILRGRVSTLCDRRVKTVTEGGRRRPFIDIPANFFLQKAAKCERHSQEKMARFGKGFFTAGLLIPSVFGGWVTCHSPALTSCQSVSQSVSQLCEYALDKGLYCPVGAAIP